MNYHLFHLINGAAGRLDRVDDVMEWSAVWLIYVLGGLAAAALLARLRTRGPAHVVPIVASLALAFALGQMVAAVSTEVRPFQTHSVHQLIAHDPGASLPSDHATAAFAVAFAVGVFVSWRWGVVLSMLATLIGFARIWTGVHYPADIAAGALIAAVAVVVVTVGTRVARRWRRGRFGAALDGQ